MQEQIVFAVSAGVSNDILIHQGAGTIVFAVSTNMSKDHPEYKLATRKYRTIVSFFPKRRARRKYNRWNLGIIVLRRV